MANLLPMQLLVQLREKVSEIPKAPGVYIHKDHNAQVLYVGKAKNLQNRLRSYFTSLHRHTAKTQALVASIHDFEVILVRNEHESLLLENHLVKHHRPPYNILLKDDKDYPSLKLTLHEKWPRLLITRQRKKDGSLYFGPFTNSGDLYALKEVIEKSFPLVKCSPTVFKAAKRPCNYFHIKKCLAPCALPVNHQDYQVLVKHVRAVLDGKITPLRSELEKRMINYSAKLQFEKAAMVRDQLAALKNLKLDQSVVFAEPVDIDHCHIWENRDYICFYLQKIRGGRLLDGQGFILEYLYDDVEARSPAHRERLARTQTLQSFLFQYYDKHRPPENGILLPFWGREIQQMLAEMKTGFAELLKSRFSFEMPEPYLLNSETKLPWKKIVQKQLFQLSQTSQRNAQRYFEEQLGKTALQRAFMEGLKDILRLKRLPRYVECFDISTFQGHDTVASQVVFRDGRKSKSDYRRYKIRSVSGQDDFASMREVIGRRFSEKNKELTVPDIIFLDGGEPQLREVLKVTQHFDISLTLVGIAKARVQQEFQSQEIIKTYERLVIPRSLNGTPQFETIPLEVGSAAYQMVTQIRDEAHRFAITYHRKQRSRKSMGSLLDEIQGIGPKRKKIILQSFPHLNKLAEKKPEVISDVTGIPVRLATEIITRIKKTKR